VGQSFGGAAASLPDVHRREAEVRVRIVRFVETLVKFFGHRKAILEANRLLWLVGAIAFLNDCVSGSWGDMLEIMHEVLRFPWSSFFLTYTSHNSMLFSVQEYAPTFRAVYLRNFLLRDHSEGKRELE